MTKQNWHDIYRAGQQLNRYPYDFIVSGFYRHRPDTADGHTCKVLDLGCGAGNHALFCAENDAQVLATDFSQAALDVVAQRARDKGLSERITTCQIDFEDFGLQETGFDIVIDRLAVSHVSKTFAMQLYDRVADCLNPGGIILSSLFTTGHSHKDFGRYDSEQDIWTHFTDGIFENLKTAYFYSEDDIRQLFRKYSLQTLTKVTDADMLNHGQQLETWNVIAGKRSGTTT